MKVQLVTSLTVVAVAAVGSFHLYSAATLDAPKPILVQDAAWKMRYDSKLDGELSAKGDGEVRWKFAVRNNRISGSLADLKDGDPADHRLAGEIVEGEPPIVFLRQDGPKG